MSIFAMLLSHLILFLGVALPLIKCQDTKTEEYYLELLQEFLQNNSKWEYPTDNKKFFHAENEIPDQYGKFDFIIIGAGTAGSVLTNRLTESGRFNVLVLEAGGQENDFTEVPGFVPYLLKSDFNWGYKTIPQKNACLGLKNRQCNYARGKALGGSSSINFMVYTRGNKEDFNKWGRTNPGWDYESILPYYKKSENSTVLNQEPEYHGHSGPLRTETSSYYINVTETFLAAMQQSGQGVIDYNGKKQIGCSRTQATTDNGRRCSGNRAFIKPAMSRTNLHVRDNALVLKILIQGKKAYGVEFIYNGVKYAATASKEIIVSAGAINSPQLLMLSGIGPKGHLKEVGVPLVHDLPVGQNYHDHQIFAGLIFATNLTVTRDDIGDSIKSYLNGKGPLTAPSGITALAFRSPKIPFENPSVEYVLMAGFLEDIAPFFLDFLEVTDENWQALSQPLTGKFVWGIIPIYLHPKSTGTIKLKTKDPLDFPLIDPNLYSDFLNCDTKEMITIIKDVLKISKTPAFQSIGSEYLSQPFPACSHLAFMSDNYLKCALKLLTSTVLHAVGSCKMGPFWDRNAVVDSELRVYGIKSLRVIDSSVIPFSIAAHPAPTTFMVGEKGADLIRRDYSDL